MKEKINKILSKEGKKLFSITMIRKESKLFLSVRRNQKQIYQRTTRFGKNILYTDNHSWSSEKIIQTSRGKNVVEDNFKKMKNRSTVSFMPMWHWTDQKIRVHAFYCVISLLLLNLLQKQTTRKYKKMSLEEIADKLSDVKEILLFYPDTMKPARKLSEKDDMQERLYQIQSRQIRSQRIRAIHSATFEILLALCFRVFNFPIWEDHLIEQAPFLSRDTDTEMYPYPCYPYRCQKIASLPHTFS